MSAQAFPLYWPEGWKRTKYRKNSAFKISHFGKARDFLLGEVRRMGGKNIVLSTNIALRNDGLPYANQRNPDDPGVAVYFLYKQKQMSFACDAYRKIEENAYAIAKTIEALRGIERWGASDMMERAFRGFAALADGSKRPWREVLGVTIPNPGVLDVEEAFRKLARIHHPDTGGDTSRFQELVSARDEAKKEISL